ncbi:MAG: phosphoribosylformylglycinamidine synthase [Candidatus Proteinoplasmatales archaeon SG8-5]|nr:MAG: phosphoribosylformylglycinamidine synthase [Candidatus Proteinoplasmatales archaeon SG8-5]
MKVCVLRIEGTNCEEESYQAFARLGAQPELVHLKQLLGRDVNDDERRDLLDYHVLMIPGGFSSGDYVRAGAIWAARMRKLEAPLTEFIGEGRAVLGVCNGFQVLIELGLLPAFNGIMSQQAQAVLTTNDSSRFECRPTILKHENKSNCIFTSKLYQGQTILCPSAHAEGKLLFPEDEAAAIYARLEENDQVVFKYVDPEGNYSGYPWNPNGSPYNIAGICNPAGNVMGMMPHPERVFHRHTHPDWTRELPTEVGDGRAIFESVIEAVSKRF